MNTTLRVAMLLLALTSFAYGQSGISPDTPFCLSDNYNNFWSLNIYQGTPGQMLVYGHVHHLGVDKKSACYTQDLIGSGRYYQGTVEGGHIAHLTLQVISGIPFCDEFTITVQGDTRNQPVIYTGMGLVNDRRLVHDVKLTLLPDCSSHP